MNCSINIGNLSQIPRAASNRYLSEVQNGSFSLDAKRRQIKGQAERDDVEIVRIFADPAQSAHRKKYNPAINAMRRSNMSYR